MILPIEIINKIMSFMSHPVSDLLKPEIEQYINYYNNENVPFVEFYFKSVYDEDDDYDYDYNNYCDCCTLDWVDCLCCCHRCGDEYKYCRTRCYNDVMS